MTKLTWARAAAWRVRRQYLDARAPAGKMLAVASRLCGLHAQLMSSAELTLWARVNNLEREAVQRALWDDRTLVKTWAMRGTLHLLPSSELHLWHAALRTNSRYLRPEAWRKYFGISMEELERLSETVAIALENRVLTRDELVKEIGRLMGSAFSEKAAANSWGTIFKPAAFTGRLCFGPNLGTRVQFTRPDTWLALTPNALDSEEATAEVTRRFLTAHGPATVYDLARWWNGGGLANARQWMKALGDEVSPVDLEGAEAWMLTSDLRKLRQFDSKPSVSLLPAFDQYVITASFHASRLMPGDFRGRVFRPQGWISPVLLVNGRMDGIWRHAIKGNSVEVAIEPFGKIPTWARRAAAQEAERLAAFLGAKLKLTWKTK